MFVPHRKTWIAALFIFGLIGIGSLAGWLYIKLRAKTYLSKEEVNTRIAQELPKGATVEEVKRFATLFDSRFEIGVSPYLNLSENKGMTAAQDAPVNTHGYCTALIRKTGVIPTALITWNMQMVFYFDEQRHLLDYKVRTIGDGL